MTHDIANKLESFYDLSKSEQEDTLISVLKIANSDPINFKEIIIQEEFNGLNNLPVFYEALTKDLQNWDDFFLTEINRLFETARKSKTPSKILSHLDELSYIDPNKFKHRDEFIRILKKELNNDHPTFRYYAISLIPDFIEKDDFQTIKELRKHLTDSDWKIRYWTHLALQDIDELKKYDKLSLYDRIRVELMDTLNFK
tara:strand:- start:60 stop:656 length:597 start_codon:yes stop_codon:yes gene_type:complete